MKFTELYQCLINNAEIIQALLLNVTEEEAVPKPGNDGWSILEVVCHLYDTEREDFREHLDFILHRQYESWHPIDPQEWVITRNYNQQNFSDMQKKYFEERVRSLDWLIDQAGENWDTVYLSEHGSLKAGDMLCSWVAHDHLHIRQLVELKRLQIETLALPYRIDYAGDW